MAWRLSIWLCPRVFSLNPRITVLKSSIRCYSAMAGYLIDVPKYSWLKELGLSSQNDGVYTGTWGASGEVNAFFVNLWFL